MIVGVTGEKQVHVKLEDWSFLAMGLGHVILKNDHKEQDYFWKVMIICRHQMHTSPVELENLYFQVIKSVPTIKKHLLAKEAVEFSQDGRKMLKEYINNTLMIEAEIPDNFIVAFADNLNRSRDGWQFSFQYKPKTPLPDKYSPHFLQTVAANIQIKPDLLQEIINNRPIIEKIRWFKKNLYRDKKTNMNPLEIFGLSESQLPLIVKTLKKMETFDGQLNLTEEDYKVLNHRLFQQISKSDILSSILDLQLLFIAPSDFVEMQIEPLWSQQTDKQKIIETIRHNVTKQLQQPSQGSIATKAQKIINSSAIIKDTEQHKNDLIKIQRIFRFLLSWTWRDVSLVIRIKLQPNSLDILDVDFTIIDYQIKQASKLKETIEKDYSFFRNYLKHLNMI